MRFSLKYFIIQSKWLAYYKRNKKLSPLASIMYEFLKLVYMYMTKQILDKDTKHKIYVLYLKITSKAYFPNRDSPNPNMQENLIIGLNIILNDQIKSPFSFIMLNSFKHYQLLQQFLKHFESFLKNEKYYGYASEKEFFEALDNIRGIISKKYKFDVHKEVGKIPKRLKHRRIKSNGGSHA